MIALHLPGELDCRDRLQDSVERPAEYAGLLAREDGDRSRIEQEGRAVLCLAWCGASIELPLQRGVQALPIARRPRNPIDRRTPGRRLAGVAREERRKPIEVPGVLSDERPNPRKSRKIDRVADDRRRDRF